MITCFLIDDDQDEHDFFEMAIKQIHSEMTMHFAGNGREGLNVLSALKPQPDVIFLDMNMPLMGGLEFLDEFKKTNFKDIPVIMYSTSDERFFQQKALDRGASAYLTKATTMAMLREGISKKLNELNLL